MPELKFTGRYMPIPSEEEYRKSKQWLAEFDAFWNSDGVVVIKNELYQVLMDYRNLVAKEVDDWEVEHGDCNNR